MKSDALGKIKDFLVSGGFSTFEYPRGCFDIAARRERLLLLKVLTNIDSFQKDQAKDLKLLSKFLSSSCFLLGEKTRRERLNDSVIYERFGVPAMTIDTFTSVVDGKYPGKFRARGGTFGRIDPNELKRYRKKNNVTQSDLADKLGVSQKRISEYESGEGSALLNMVRALEELVGGDIRQGVNPFEMEADVQTDKGKEGEISQRLADLGFRTGHVKRAPPRLLVRSDSTVLSRVMDTKRDENNIPSLVEFSKVSGTDVFIITEDRKDIESVPCIRKNRLDEIEDSKELLSIIEEKKRSA